MTLRAIDHRVALPSYVTADQAKASYRNDRLVITFSKKEERGERVIPIETKRPMSWPEWKAILTSLKNRVRSLFHSSDR